MEFTDLQIFIHLSDTKKLHQNRHPKPHVSLYPFPSNSTIGRRVREDTFIRDNRQVKLTEYGEKFYNLLKQNGKTGNNLNNN